MSVSIIWSTSQGGAGISSIVDHGNAANGEATTDLEIYLRHNGANEITNVGLYIRQISGDYTGSFTAASDIAEVLSWGTNNTQDGFGGFLVNFNATETPTPYTSGWATWDNKSPANGFVHRSGVGDSEASAVTLPTSTGAAVEGEIAAGTPNVRFKVRIEVPNSEDELGVRQFEQVLRYNFTS